MKYILPFLFFIISDVFGKDFITDFHGITQIDTFTYPNGETFSSFSDSNSWTNSLGDYGKGTCMGTVSSQKVDIICQYTNQKNEKFWSKAIRVESNIENKKIEDRGVGKSIYIHGTGKYKHLVGTTCPYAVTYLEDRYYTIEKCNLTDEVYDLLSNN